MEISAFRQPAFTVLPQERQEELFFLGDVSVVQVLGNKEDKIITLFKSHLTSFYCVFLQYTLKLQEKFSTV